MLPLVLSSDQFLANPPVGVRLLRLMGWKDGQSLSSRIQRAPHIPPTVGPPVPSVDQKRRVFGLQLSLEELLDGDSSNRPIREEEPTPVCFYIAALRA